MSTLTDIHARLSRPAKHAIAAMFTAAVILAWEAPSAVGDVAPTQIAPRVGSAPSAVAPVSRPAVATVSRSAERAPLKPRVAAPPAPVAPVASAAPAPRILRIVAVASPEDAQLEINRCAGAVEVAWSSDPHEIAEHDFCGGAWFASVAAGTAVEVVGGTRPGLYVANGNRQMLPKGADSSALDGLGDLVLQTCDGDSLIVIGLSRA